MKATLAAFVWFFSLSFASPALGQGAARWLDPAGAFSVDVNSRGWQVADPSANPEWFIGDMIFFAYARLVDGRPDDLCYATIERRIPTLAPIARTNEITRQMAQSSVSENRPPPFRLERAETTDVDGVAVLDVYGAFETLDTVERRFFIHRAGETQWIRLQCSVQQTNSDAVADAHAIAGSLRFQHGDMQ